ncbi:MAG TPA: TlpA disulfide reductase family protein [Candidatus Acidoferrales bacterium]|nr:TlpA disulfide reductase family protein [Candidatus Acidoferrales bacterium]
MSALPRGTTAPPISLADASGKKLSLAEALKNGPVLAAFFKVSCPTCQFTVPFLERLHQTYGGAKFTLLGISQDDARNTRDFCEEYGVQFPALIDERGYPVSNEYGLTNVPTMFWISPEGQIQTTSVGFSKTDLEQIAAQVAQATGKPSAPLFKPGEVIPETKPG